MLTGIVASREHDGNRRSRRLGRERCRVSASYNHGALRRTRSAASAGSRSNPIICPAVFDRYVLALDIALPSFRPRRNADNRCAERIKRRIPEEADHRHRRLLRARRERPRRRRAAEQRDELAALHSITSSARASSGRRHVEAERLGGLEVDHQLVLGRRLHRQVGRLLALEDAIDVAGARAILIDPIGPIGDQAADSRIGRLG